MVVRKKTKPSSRHFCSGLAHSPASPVWGPAPSCLCRQPPAPAHLPCGQAHPRGACCGPALLWMSSEHPVPRTSVVKVPHRCVASVSLPVNGDSAHQCAEGRGGGDVLCPAPRHTDVSGCGCRRHRGRGLLPPLALSTARPSTHGRRHPSPWEKRRETLGRARPPGRPGAQADDRGPEGSRGWPPSRPPCFSPLLKQPSFSQKKERGGSAQGQKNPQGPVSHACPISKLNKNKQDRGWICTGGESHSDDYVNICVPWLSHFVTGA